MVVVVVGGAIIVMVGLGGGLMENYKSVIFMGISYGQPGGTIVECETQSLNPSLSNQTASNCFNLLSGCSLKGTDAKRTV